MQGCTFAVASDLIYVARARTAVLTYVGTVLIATWHLHLIYLRMAEVLNLVAFMISLRSQHMAFSASLLTSS
jgi:ATP-binding cassette, subfamily B (MDR/TAP), member 1